MTSAEEISKLTQELKSSEEKTRLIMANIPVGLIVMRGDGTIEAANSKIETLFQHKRSALAKKPLAILFPEGAIANTSANGCTTRQAFGRKADGQRFPCEVTEIEVE